MRYPTAKNSALTALALILTSILISYLYGAFSPSSVVPLSHCRLADLSIYYGITVLFSGLGLILISRARFIKSPELLKYLRLIHVIVGIITSLLGILTYLSVP